MIRVHHPSAMSLRSLACLSVPCTLVALAAGCSGRTITIEQDPYVNTGMQCDRPAGERTGEPLELNVVMVYPKDLDDERNDQLRPGSGITSQAWFSRRPQPGDSVDAETGNNFRLKPDQIFLLTNDSSYYGQRIGQALRGASLDGARVTKGGIDFDNWASGDSKSVIYVFGRFTDKNGSVLPVPPAVINPPSAYAKDMVVKVSVSGGCTQSISNITPRK